MTTSFVESGMTFGPYAPPDDCFHIEKSALYQSMQKGIKMAECILVKAVNGKPAVWIIEAKQSLPRPAPQSNRANQIAAIIEKLSNAFSLGVASILGRHLSANLPQSFYSIDFKNIQIFFILIINGYSQDGARQATEDLRKRFPYPLRKTWAIREEHIFVMNEQYARRRGLISAP